MKLLKMKRFHDQSERALNSDDYYTDHYIIQSRMKIRRIKKKMLIEEDPKIIYH